jgi:hypothetical protein
MPPAQTAAIDHQFCRWSSRTSKPVSLFVMDILLSIKPNQIRMISDNFQ